MNGPLPTELKFRENTVFILFDASMQCFGLFINKSTAELSSLFSYYLSDTSLFHLPSRSTAIHKQSTVFGVSCYKQVDSKVCYNFLLLLTSAGLVSTKAPDCKAGCHRCDLRIHVLLWLQTWALLMGAVLCSPAAQSCPPPLLDGFAFFVWSSY